MNPSAKRRDRTAEAREVRPNRVYPNNRFRFSARVEATPDPVGWAQTVGSALMVVARAWIAWTVVRKPASQLGAEAQPRVQ